MKTQFNYTPSNPLVSGLTPFLMGIALIVIPIVYPFNISLGRKLVILPHPYSAIVLVAIGVLLLLQAFSTIRKDRALTKNPRPIVVEDGKFSFADIKKGVSVEQTFAISDIEKIDFDDEDDELTVKIGTSFYKFKMDYFDTPELFAQFRTLITVEK